MPAPVVGSVIKDTAIVKIGGVAWGATRGGIRRIPNRELKGIDFDGKRSAHIVGHDRFVGFGERAEFRMIEFGSQAQFDRLEHVSVGAPARPPAGELFTAARYLPDVTIVYTRTDGSEVRLRYPYALVMWTEVQGADKSEAELAVAIESVQAVHSDAPAYTIEIGPAVGAGNPNLPPNQQASILWAFDPSLITQDAQTGSSLVGPSWTRGSTSGSDTNDPTHLLTTPGRYTFDSNDYMNFGDVLDTLWTHTDGFTLMEAIEIVADDLLFSKMCLSKDSTGSDRTFWMRLWDGQLNFQVFVNGVTGNENITSNAALTTGKKTVAVSYDRSLAFGSRLKLYVNGSLVASTLGTGGADGPVNDSVAQLRIGLDHGGFSPPVGIQSHTYGWPGALSAGDISANDAWIRGAGRGWA